MNPTAKKEDDGQAKNIDGAYAVFPPLGTEFLLPVNWRFNKSSSLDRGAEVQFKELKPSGSIFVFRSQGELGSLLSFKMLRKRCYHTDVSDFVCVSGSHP